MNRRRLLVFAMLSAALAIVFGFFAMRRPSDVGRVRKLGTITPTTVAPVASQAHAGTSAASVVTTTTTSPVISDPTQLSITSIGVNASIMPVGVEPGTNTVQIPDIDHVGWYRFGPTPGEDGSAVLVGHVDGQGRPGVFWRLRDLVPGDDLTIAYADGTHRTFRVIGREETRKTQLPADLFSRAGPPRLALITCGGSFNATTRHYLDNVFVIATPE